MRSSFRSPEAPAACSTNCRMLSCRIAIRLLSSDSDRELSLPMMHPLMAEACLPYTLRLLHRLQQRDVVRDRSTAHVEDAGELRVLELHALGRLAGELHRAHHMHGDTGRADRMALRFQAAGRVDRQLAVFLRPALLDGPGALPAWR